MALLARLGLAGVGQRSLYTSTLRGYWRTPTSAVNGTVLHMIVLGGSAPTYTIMTQGEVTVASGYASILASSGAPGDKALALLHNYDGNTATTSIYGGPSIATHATV